MFPWAVEVKPPIIWAIVMADPLPVMMDVRGFGVAGLIAERRSSLRLSIFARTSFAAPRFGGRSLPHGAVGGRSVPGDISSAHGFSSSTLAGPLAVSIMLSERWKRECSGDEYQRGESEHISAFPQVTPIRGAEVT